MILYLRFLQQIDFQHKNSSKYIDLEIKVQEKEGEWF